MRIHIYIYRYQSATNQKLERTRFPRREYSRIYVFLSIPTHIIYIYSILPVYTHKYIKCERGPRAWESIHRGLILIPLPPPSFANYPIVFLFKRFIHTGFYLTPLLVQFIKLPSYMPVARKYIRIETQKEAMFSYIQYMYIL